MLLDLPLDPEALDLVMFGLVVAGALEAENEGPASQRRAVVSGRARASAIERADFFTAELPVVPAVLVEQRIPDGAA